MIGCQGEKGDKKIIPPEDLIKPVDTTEETNSALISPPPKIYANERFRNVSVTHLGDHEFRISGQAQIFEASFNYVIEDGHNELAKGFSTTDAGAPEWGNFSFTVKAEKETENSTLHLILFESSAKDGSRTHELPIPLY